MDTNNLTSGEDFAQLPDTYVIFILDYDLKTRTSSLSGQESFLEDHSDFDDGTRFILLMEIIGR